MGLTPCEAEQPLRGMELQNNKFKKIKTCMKSFWKEPTDKRCLLIQALKSFRP